MFCFIPVVQTYVHEKQNPFQPEPHIVLSPMSETWMFISQEIKLYCLISHSEVQLLRSPDLWLTVANFCKQQKGASSCRLHYLLFIQ